MTLYQGTASFLNGLSDFWIKFFKDKEMLAALYRGSEALIGQAYLDIVSNVLNVSVRETPLFNKELYRLLTIREDQVAYDYTLDRWVYALPDNIKDFKCLYNKIFAPTVIMEKGVHSDVCGGFEIDCTGDNDELRFYIDPFDWEGSGEPIPGVAFRIVDVTQDDGAVVQKRQLAFWAPDASLDHYNLYLTYGYLLGRFEPSTEAYRALLRGIMNYFTMGPTLARVEGILNVVVGLPTARDDGEVLQSVTVAEDGTQTVTTSLQEYVFTAGIPLRTDILDPANWGTLEFLAVEPLTRVFVAQDAVENPAWWYGTSIPQRLMPKESYGRRYLDPKMYDNLINNPPGLVQLGDPGFIIGADEDGFIPTWREGKRHTYAFICFERFLRHHVFNVTADAEAFTSGLLPYPRTEQDLNQIVIAGSSAYTYLYVAPELLLSDTAIVMDDDEGLYVKTSAIFDDLVTSATDSDLLITPRSWLIGDYYRYDSGSLVLDNPVARGGNPFEDDDDNQWVVLGGGVDPTHTSHRLADDESGANLMTISDSGVSGKLRATLGTGRFLSEDVGMWLWLDAKSTYYEITDVLSDTVVYFAVVGAKFTGSFAWSLWKEYGGHQGAGLVDRPLEVRVIPAHHSGSC